MWPAETYSNILRDSSSLSRNFLLSPGGISVAIRLRRLTGKCSRAHYGNSFFVDLGSLQTGGKKQATMSSHSQTVNSTYRWSEWKIKGSQLTQTFPPGFGATEKDEEDRRHLIFSQSLGYTEKVFLSRGITDIRGTLLYDTYAQLGMKIQECAARVWLG